MKEHNLSTAPQNVAAIPTPAKQTKNETVPLSRADTGIIKRGGKGGRARNEVVPPEIFLSYLFLVLIPFSHTLVNYTSQQIQHNVALLISIYYFVTIAAFVCVVLHIYPQHLLNLFLCFYGHVIKLDY